MKTVLNYTELKIVDLEQDVIDISYEVAVDPEHKWCVELNGVYCEVSVMCTTYYYRYINIIPAIMPMDSYWIHIGGAVQTPKPNQQSESYVLLKPNQQIRMNGCSLVVAREAGYGRYYGIIPI